jgi:hypothetical protein
VTAATDWRHALPELRTAHAGPFGGVTWSLDCYGVAIDADPPIGTPGPPASALRVWQWFGQEIRAAARKHDVPAELIVATICTEAAGGKTDRAAVCQGRREEPGFVSDAETPARVSVGCMQTLISTAAEFLMRPVTAAELQDPAVAIDAGAAMIAAQFWSTRFDPPLVGAAYNAGGVYHDPAAANRWRLRCYPIGTGAHVDRFVAWFNDAMRLTVAAERAGDAPSFIAAFLDVDAA